MPVYSYGNTEQKHISIQQLNSSSSRVHKVFQRLQRKTNDKFACYLPYYITSNARILNIVFIFWLFDDYWKNLTSTVDHEKWKVASEKKS